MLLISASKNLFKKKLFKSVIIFVLLLSAGFMWQHIMVSYEEKQLKYPGQLFDVNNHKMHIYGEGDGRLMICINY